MTGQALTGGRGFGTGAGAVLENRGPVLIRLASVVDQMLVSIINFTSSSRVNKYMHTFPDQTFSRLVCSLRIFT